MTARRWHGESLNELRLVKWACWKRILINARHIIGALDWMACVKHNINNFKMIGKWRDGWRQQLCHHIWKNQSARKNWWNSRGNKRTMMILLQRLRVMRIYLRSWHRPPKHERNKRHLQYFVKQFSIDRRCFNADQPIVPHPSKSGPSESDFARVQINSFGTTYQSAVQVADLVRTALQVATPGVFNSVTVQTIYYDGEAHLSEDYAGFAGIYHIASDYIINYAR